MRTAVDRAYAYGSAYTRKASRSFFSEESNRQPCSPKPMRQKRRRYVSSVPMMRRTSDPRVGRVYVAQNKLHSCARTVCAAADSIAHASAIPASIGTARMPSARLVTTDLFLRTIISSKAASLAASALLYRCFS
jgi:hypothetical protein